MTDQILLSSPDVTQMEEDALIRAIRSGWIAPCGPELDAFEQELAAYSGRRHAVALSSGTAALHLALITLGVGPGDKVLTPTMTFAATANSIVYTGAEPVFVDADETGNMSPDLLQEAFVTLAREGQKIKAVLPVDFLGKIADHASIGSIAGRYGVPVVSDAAESFGAIQDGRQSGSFGIAAAVSFNGNKFMTTSGGGVFLTDCAVHAIHVRYLATQARQPGPYYQHTEIGYNYRLSNVLAALGRAQLSRLDSMIDQRRKHRLHYRELFASVPGVTLFGEPSGADAGPTRENFSPTRDNFWLTSIMIEPHRAGFSADQFRLYLAGADIEARPMWKPMHLQPLYADARSFIDGTSERLFCTGLSLPSGSVLNQHQIARVDSVINDFLERRRVAA